MPAPRTPASTVCAWYSSSAAQPASRRRVGWLGFATDFPLTIARFAFRFTSDGAFDLFHH